MAELERDVRDHAKTLSEYAVAIGRHDTRLYAIERDGAVREESDKSIEARLTKIETILSRLTWLLVTGIGGAVVAFVISGGLSHVSIG